MIQSCMAAFLYAFILSMIISQLDTDQSPFSCNQSPKIRRLVTDRSQTVPRLWPYQQRLVAEKLLINRWQVPNMSINWLHWSQWLIVNHNDISREEIKSRSQCLCNCSFNYSNRALFDLVWFLFYSPSTHFRSFWARSVNLATLFLGKPPRQFTST